MRRYLSALLPVVLYAGLIVALSSRSVLPGSKLVWDKAAHFGEYLILAFLLARAAAGIKGLPAGRAAAWGALLATAFGFTDELHQFFVPGRDASGWDVLADALGSGAGAAAWIAWRRFAARPSPGRAAGGSPG